MAKRDVMSVEITPAARDAIDRLAERLAMKKTVLVGRLMHWFAEQGEEVQQAILHPPHGRMRSATVAVLESICRELREQDEAFGLITDSAPPPASPARRRPR